MAARPVWFKVESVVVHGDVEVCPLGASTTSIPVFELIWNGHPGPSNKRGT